LIADLVALQYKRTSADFTRGTFRVRGDVIDIFPAHYEDRAWRVNLFGDTVENIEEFDPLTGHKQDDLEFIKIYANSHYVTPRPTLVQAIKSIKSELKLRLDELNNHGRLLEAQRLEQRTTFDLEMMEATGSCAGIENYSRYLTGRRPGEPPPTLFEYVPDNALVFEVKADKFADLFAKTDDLRDATLARFTADEAKAQAGLGARSLHENGGVGLVLGAGNISAIAPLDALYELVAHNRTSIIKLNPTFANLKPILDRAFAPMISLDLLRIVNGGAATGGYLTEHELVGHVHITGSGLTHDAIVWGTGAAGTKRRKAGKPKLTKEITSELGGVSPIIVVPGKWSRGELKFQAEHVATQRLHNSGHNCIAGQALVLSADWDQREEFLDALREVLDNLPAREPWYPGSEAKIASAHEAYPAAKQHGDCLLVEVDDNKDLFTTEYFAPVLGITTVPGLGAEFLANAVTFANDELDGTLGASIIVHPSDRKRLGAAFDNQLEALRYGTIGVNAWSAVGFLLPGAPWGAYPGHTLDAVGSGIGIVHNAYLIEGAEKTVVTGPFRPFPDSVRHGELTLAPKPPWFVTAKTAAATGRALTDFGAKRSWARAVKVVLPAMRG